MNHEIASLLETAAMLIRRGEAPNAAWRVADAGLLLRESLEADGHTNLIGLDEITGRGVTLPRPRTIHPAEDASMRALSMAVDIVRPRIG